MAVIAYKSQTVTHSRFTTPFSKHSDGNEVAAALYLSHVT